MPVTVHEGTTFLVSDDRGDFEPGSEGGLFHLDTRFLSRHALRLDGKAPVLLQSFVPEAHRALHFLTNPPLDGARSSTLAIVVRRELGGGVRERIQIENYGDQQAHFELGLSFDSDFEYILTVKKNASGGGADRSWKPRVRWRIRDGREALLELDEGGTPHRTSVAFHPPPDQLAPGGSRHAVALEPRQRWELDIEVSPSIGDDVVRPAPPSSAQRHAAGDRHQAITDRMPGAESDHPVLARAFAQASRDLAALRLKAETVEADEHAQGDYAIAAGIPWYMDLFGRDSLIASYASMLSDPALAHGTLDALARLQGKKVDRTSEEAPGKILHEYRRGPLTPAARKLIPTYPYYGTIDATPLFLVTLSEYVRATGDLGFARDRWQHVTAALEWMRRYGDRDGDGLLEYQRDSDIGLVNQGWKDSNDSIRFRDGRIADPPIALVEVQGYAWDARRRTAELARALGHRDEADRLEQEADQLRRALRERYWLADRSFFAEALDGRKRPVDSLTSNPGHLLWAGALEAQDARAVADALLGPEMFSGFGVRTMGSREGGFNPVSYHNGSVWPHDNALLLAGLVRYGLRDHASRLAAALLSALGQLPSVQPPELFCGFDAQEVATPIRYPTACRPQAWASASVILLMRCVLGLQVNALARQVALAPMALPGMTRLEVKGIPAGGGRLDVSVRVQGDRASADLSGLPDGWQRVEAIQPD